MTEASACFSLESIHGLLETANLSQIPATICKLMQGDACVIWKPSRSLAVNPSPDRNPGFGQLYPYSSTFSSQSSFEHAGIAMELLKDTTGRFYCSGKTNALQNDFLKHDPESQSDQFMRGHDLKKVCIARFKMPDSQVGYFVVSVYRKSNSPDFKEQDSIQLETLARFLPTLYQRLVASQLQSVVVKVNSVLRPRCADLVLAKTLLEKLCHEIATFFSFQEISIFIRDESPESKTYSLVASTYPHSKIPTLSYYADVNDGLTGYVLATKRTAWFHDLHNFESSERLSQINTLYPNAKWRDGAALGKQIAPTLDTQVSKSNPPLPFVAVPILSEDQRVLGVVRASVGLNPFHFLEEQVNVFEIIAQEIGRWWESIQFVIEQQRRAQIWEALDNTITEQHEAFKGTENISELITTTVRSIAEQPGFSLAVFRRGTAQDQLRVVALCSDAYGRKESPKTKFLEIGEVLPLIDSTYQRPQLVGGFSVGKCDRNAHEIATRGSVAEVVAFRGMSWVLSRPVYIESRLYGILDIGFRREQDYYTGKARIDQFVNIVSRQLALFVRIAESVALVEATISKELETNNVTTHQLRTPITTAYKQLRKLTLLSPNQWNEAACKRLEEVGGMISKARSVTHTMEAIGKIVAGETVRVLCKVVMGSDIKKTVIEVAKNAHVVLDEEMRLKFSIEPENWGQVLVYWDDLLGPQCLDAVVVNAFKYSAVGESVTITGGLINNFFFIRIVNVGPYIIGPEDVEKCKAKDWRGMRAREQEGQGIGLWIADNWMKAQGGELKVYETSKSGETKIELWFARK